VPSKTAEGIVSPLFPDVVQCMAIQVLEIKKSKLPCLSMARVHDDSYCAVVYLYLVNYGRSRPEEVTSAISGFLSVSAPR
jgi:hypothetical protein